MATLRTYQSYFYPTSLVSKSRYGTGIRFSLSSRDSMRNALSRPSSFLIHTLSSSALTSPLSCITPRRSPPAALTRCLAKQTYPLYGFTTTVAGRCIFTRSTRFRRSRLSSDSIALRVAHPLRFLQRVGSHGRFPLEILAASEINPILEHAAASAAPAASSKSPLHSEPMRSHVHLYRLAMAFLISIALNVILFAVDFSIDPRRAELSRIQRSVVSLLSPAGSEVT